MGDLNRDGAGLRLMWEGCKLQLKAIDILARLGRVTRGAQNARCGDSKIPKRDQARDENGSATARGDKIETGLGKGQVARRRAEAKGRSRGRHRRPPCGRAWRRSARPPSFRRRLGCPQTLHQLLRRRSSASARYPAGRTAPAASAPAS